jgi:hypothetical protein
MPGGSKKKEKIRKKLSSLRRKSWIRKVQARMDQRSSK